MPYREMRSQAGHDAYAVATIAPTAMIFTPCHEGISHNVNENIELVRSVPGANLAERGRGARESLIFPERGRPASVPLWSVCTRG